jgi:hypothetical protein
MSAQVFGELSTVLSLPGLTRLDPAIHLLLKKLLAKMDGCPDQVRSSPGMTIVVAAPPRSQTHVRAPRREAPEPCIYLSPPGGRGECRMPAAPAASRALCIGRKHTSNNEYTGTPGIPARNGFNGLCRALPGDRALLPPLSADMFCLSPVGPTQLRELDASVGASGPHDFAVRSNISRQRAL